MTDATNLRSLGSDIADVSRRALANIVETGKAELADPLSAIVAAMAKSDAENGADLSRLRAWHELLVDGAAALSDLSQRSSEELTRAADAVRRTILLIERNPPGQLASRPASRRILIALQELGGANCAQARVRERAGHSQTHFSNCVKPLLAAGFVRSESDPANGRERRLSLTTEGRRALAERPRERPMQKPGRLHVLSTASRRSSDRRPPVLRQREAPTPRFTKTLEVL